MADNRKKIEQLTAAYQAGMLDKETYEASVSGLRENPGQPVEFKNSRVGVMGDNTSVKTLNVYSGPDPSDRMAGYLEGVAAATDRLPWARMSREQAGPDRQGRLRLSQVYTALDTMEPDRAGCEADVRQCLREITDDRRISAQEMVNRHSFLVLLGDPGSGKTTLINYLAHAMARASLGGTPEALPPLAETGEWDHGALLPIRVILREFGSWLPSCPKPDKGLDLWLKEQIEDEGGKEVWPLILQRLRDGKRQVLVLLDGLDEVAGEMRPAVKESVESFTERFPDNRFIVSCRIHAYDNPEFRLDGFRQVVLAPFSLEQIHGFIHGWYNALAGRNLIDNGSKDALTAEFKEAVGLPELLDLARNPLIMTVMAMLHTSDGRLPDDRVDLYEWICDLLFSRWKGQRRGEKGLAAALGRPRPKKSELMAAIYHVAFEVHKAQGRSRGPADIEEFFLLKILKPYLGNSYDKAKSFADYIRERTGLLICHKPEVYTFPHRTFQEYLAACHLTSLGQYPSEAARLVQEDPGLWQEAFILAAGRAAKNLQPGNAVSSVKELCGHGITEGGAPEKNDYTRAIIAGRAVLEIGLSALVREGGEMILNRIREWLKAALTDQDLLFGRARADAGEVLALLGDPRFDGKAWFLPKEEDWGFVRIPGGTFAMGSDRSGDQKARDNEIPRHSAPLSEYLISRYPVTVAQYRVFLDDTGNPPNERWMRYNRVDNHPVVNVSWGDAAAYCTWLTEKLNSLQNLPAGLADWKAAHGLTVSLPTEAQWEMAARGKDGRIYPCGDDLDKETANYGETGIGTSSPVGCFPDDVSFYELVDMTGNVWEWCLDGARKYTKEAVENPIGSMEKDAFRVFRGGSWYNSAWNCRAAYRIAFVPGDRIRDLGFRLALPGQQQ